MTDAGGFNSVKSFFGAILCLKRTCVPAKYPVVRVVTVKMKVSGCQYWRRRNLLRTVADQYSITVAHPSTRYIDPYQSVVTRMRLACYGQPVSHAVSKCPTGIDPYRSGTGSILSEIQSPLLHGRALT